MTYSSIQQNDGKSNQIKQKSMVRNTGGVMWQHELASVVLCVYGCHLDVGCDGKNMVGIKYCAWKGRVLKVHIKLTIE